MSSEHAIASQTSSYTAKNATDPNVLQDTASFPGASSWVGASAGTGKTKVLTDRVLRLLLPQPDGRPATDPERILCLTFTKAAAAEMALRINKTLAKWAVMNDADLDPKLSGLTGMQVDDDLRAAARQLFGRVIDVPGGLKIMTLHSFCQSVLARFPLEAGISPNFDVLDDTLASELMTAARDKVLAEQYKDSSERSAAYQSLAALAKFQSEKQITENLNALNGERSQFLSILEKFPGADALWDALCRCFDVRQDDDGSPLDPFCRFEIIGEQCLRDMCRAFLASGKKDSQKGLWLQDWLEKDPGQRAENWNLLVSAFITEDKDTKKNKPKQITKATKEFAPHIESLYDDIAQAILDVDDKYCACRMAQATYHLLTLGRAVQDHFARAKAFRGVLDFDDLIRLTRDLLAGRTTDISGEKPTDWVLYKLDGGLDHILIDEAQDTNPEQWEIIEHLTADFFEGISARSEEESGVIRTIFVVGDEKQSIFSFQRADPDKFHEMRETFRTKIEQARHDFRTVQMNISFRSTAPVLDLVNLVFDSARGRLALGLKDDPDITHSAWRAQEAGQVDIWDLQDPEDEDAQEPWALPLPGKAAEPPKARLCRMIGEHIQQRLDKEMLPSRGRALRPGDIMILLRSRKDFAAPLIRELKSRQIPVSGIDRMVLSQELVVEDMLALADFALLPEDDLALACILKSPFVGKDDDALFALAHGRKGTLWNAVKASGETELIDWLERLISRAGALRPYDFFAALLHDSCPADQDGSSFRAIQRRLGDDALDPLEEFLNSCLNYEREEIATLQGFTHWQRHHSAEIKREQEEASNHVRIMTVHGSKGLQAPVVYLPDTVLTGQSRSSTRPNLLWPNRTGLDVPIWSPSKDERCNLFITARDSINAYLDKEYQRLLYVALTRAEDHLIICGASPKSAGATTKMLEDSWYNSCAAAFDRMDADRLSDGHVDDGHGTRIAYRSLTSPQDIEAKPEKQNSREGGHYPLPPWIGKEAGSEPQPPRPLTPSRPSQPEQPVASPARKREDDFRFQRGRLTHKLLEHLPDLPKEKWEEAARAYLNRAESDLSDSVLETIWQETKDVLTHPDFAAIFGPDSMAEVPVSGLIGKTRLVSGQIDRLLITDNEILIVDYKTNRPPPTDPEDVPEIYIGQMKSYRDVLTQVYPDREVRCALIWTDGAYLMDLTAHLDK